MVGVLAEECKPHAVLVEDSASGQSLIQELKLPTSLPVLPVKVARDKVSHAQAITPLMEAGKVFLPSGAAWLDDYIDELAAFPNGAHDDCVDSTTLALNDLRTRGREPAIITYYRRLAEAQGIAVPNLPPNLRRVAGSVSGQEWRRNTSARSFGYGGKCRRRSKSWNRGSERRGS